MGLGGLARVMVALALVLLAALSGWLAVDLRATQAEQQHIADTLVPASDAARDLAFWQASAAVDLDRVLADGTGEATTRESLLAARAALDRTQRLTTGFAELQAPMRAATEAHEAWAAGAERLTESAASTTVAERPEALRALEPAYQRLGLATARLLDAIDAVRSAAARELNGLTRQLGTALIVAGTALVASWLGAFVGLRRWVLAPIDQLRADVRTAALPASHDHPIGRPGPVELADLGRDAESLRRQLVHELDQARAARAALEQDAPLVAAWEAAMRREGDVECGAVRVAGMTFAAEGLVAGDWWDVVSQPTGATAIVLGDVAGHGVHAALAAADLRAHIRAGLMRGEAPGQVLTRAAESITGWSTATAIVAVLDANARTLAYANAGHPAALVLAGDEALAWLRPTGMLLCPLTGTVHTATSEWSPGSLLVLCSDGVLEARLGDGTELGSDGLAQIARAAGARHAEGPREVLDSIAAAARDRVQAWAKDDATVVVAALAARLSISGS